jgi:hypothetical protein
MAKYSGKYEEHVLRFPVLTGPLQVQSLAGGHYGRTTVGSVTNIIAASEVAAGSLIFLTLTALTVGSEVGAREMSVLSVNPGVGFVAGTVNSCNFVQSFTLNWFIVNPTT